MSFLRKLNRSQKRQFDKLEDKEKSDILQKEIEDKILPIMNQKVAQAFADGVLFAHDYLFEKYVNRIKDKPENEQDKIITELLAEIEKRSAIYKSKKSNTTDKN